MIHQKRIAFRVAAAVIHDTRGKILIAERPPWEFPGGKIEPGETAEETIVREIQEELALDIVVERTLCTLTDVGPRTIEFVFLICRPTNNPAKWELREHNDIRWVEIKDLKNFEFHEADSLIIKNLERLPRSLSHTR